MTHWPKTAEQLKAEGYRGAHRGECRSCGHRILWTETPNGKLMPLDELCDGPHEPVWESHFASCPDAKAWRRTGSKEAA